MILTKIKHTIIKWSVLSLSIALIACEKTIDLELEESEPQIVIEAILREGNHLFEVSISKSSAFSDNSAPITIQNATVVLMDENGSNTNIPHISNGKYNTNINAPTDTRYSLSITIEGIQYLASSFMPKKVELSTLETVLEDGTAFDDEGYEVFFRFNDPATQENYYRLIHYINGVEQREASDMQIIDDNLFNGGFVKFPLTEQLFNTQETIAVELIHFDKASYDYFNSFIDITNAGGGLITALAAPSNPTTNWSGNVLGYFVAQSSDTLQIIIP